MRVLKLRSTRRALSKRLSGLGGGGGHGVSGAGAGEPPPPIIGEPPPIIISSVSLFSGSPNASLSDFATSCATTPSEK